MSFFNHESTKYTNKYVDGKLVEQTEYMYGGKVVRTFDANGYPIKLEDFPPYGFGDGSCILHKALEKYSG